MGTQNIVAPAGSILKYPFKANFSKQKQPNLKSSLTFFLAVLLCPSLYFPVLSYTFRYFPVLPCASLYFPILSCTQPANDLSFDSKKQPKTTRTKMATQHSTELLTMVKLIGLKVNCQVCLWMIAQPT